LLYLTIFTASFDHLIRASTPPGSEAAFPAADTLSVAIVLGQTALLVLVIRTLGLGTLGAAEKLAVYMATGLYLGQLGNANAHELIRRGSRWLHGLGNVAAAGCTVLASWPKSRCCWGITPRPIYWWIMSGWQPAPIRRPRARKEPVSFHGARMEG